MYKIIKFICPFVIKYKSKILNHYFSFIQLFINSNCMKLFTRHLFNLKLMVVLKSIFHTYCIGHRYTVKQIYCN